MGESLPGSDHLSSPCQGTTNGGTPAREPPMVESLPWNHQWWNPCQGTTNGVIPARPCPRPYVVKRVPMAFVAHATSGPLAFLAQLGLCVRLYTRPRRNESVATAWPRLYTPLLAGGVLSPPRGWNCGSIATSGSGGSFHFPTQPTLGFEAREWRHSQCPCFAATGDEENSASASFLITARAPRPLRLRAAFA